MKLQKQTQSFPNTFQRFRSIRLYTLELEAKNDKETNVTVIIRRFFFKNSGERDNLTDGRTKNDHARPSCNARKILCAQMGGYLITLWFYWLTMVSVSLVRAVDLTIWVLYVLSGDAQTILLSGFCMYRCASWRRKLPRSRMLLSG